ncbi:UNVERIFIED_CONTAM: hypothetical protein Slati_1682400 [Sesamum latifolium]|uniref:Uncharacterized protein n=1 Tax=Sesamum latifolium TaxID=2727402 RepID=A0AAW2WZR8_9LAMI
MRDSRCVAIESPNDDIRGPCGCPHAISRTSNVLQARTSGKVGGVAGQDIAWFSKSRTILRFLSQVGVVGTV